MSSSELDPMIRGTASSATPVKIPSARRRGSSSTDLIAQLKMLEEEGEKLRGPLVKPHSLKSSSLLTNLPFMTETQPSTRTIEDPQHRNFQASEASLGLSGENMAPLMSNSLSRILGTSRELNSLSQFRSQLDAGQGKDAQVVNPGPLPTSIPPLTSVSTASGVNPSATAGLLGKTSNTSLSTTTLAISSNPTMTTATAAPLDHTSNPIWTPTIRSTHTDNPTLTTANRSTLGHTNNPTLTTATATPLDHTSNPIWTPANRSTLGHTNNPTLTTAKATTLANANNPMGTTANRSTLGHTNNSNLTTGNRGILENTYNPIVCTANRTTLDTYTSNPILSIANRTAMGGTTNPVLSTAASSVLSATHRSLHFTNALPQTDRVLKDEVTLLRNRLRESVELCEEQKREFRSTMEELRGKLQETILNRDSILDLRQQESGEQQVLMLNMQARLQQFQEANVKQEKTILQLMQKLEGLKNDQLVSDTTFSQIRSSLASIEKRRGRAFFESDPVAGQSVTLLVHTLERCLQEYEADIDRKSYKMKQLETELGETKKELGDGQSRLVTEHEDRLEKMAAQQEEQLEGATQRARNAREQAANLQSQLTLLQEQLDHQAKEKERHVRDLEEKILLLKQEHQDEKNMWQKKRVGLEGGLDSVQSELTSVRTDKEEVARNVQALEEQVEDLKVSSERLEQELESEREQVKRLFQREDESKMATRDLETRLGERDVEIRHLTHLLETIREEKHLQLEAKVANVEKEARDKSTEQVLLLNSQLNSLSDRCHKATLELELTKSELNTLKMRHSEVSEDLNAAKLKLETVSAEKEYAHGILEDRKSDIEKLTQEREQFYRLLDERNEKMADFRSEVARLKVLLEEREKDISDLRKSAEVYTNSGNTAKQEKDTLAHQLDERVLEFEQLRKIKDQIMRKLKIREKRLKELEVEKSKVVLELDAKSKDLEVLTNEKVTLFTELKESRYEVARLKEERDALLVSADGKEESVQKEVHKLLVQLKSKEHDLKMAKRALKAKESTGGKAVMVAGKMQKEMTAKRGELDSLQTKMHWLEECLDAALQDKRILKEERERLSAALRKSSTQKEKLAKELEAYVARNNLLEKRVGALEAGLEKAAAKHASAMAQLEQAEQDMARLRLKHQLDIKEIQQTSHEKSRLTQNSSTPTQSYSTGIEKIRRDPNYQINEVPVRDKPRPETIQPSHRDHGDSEIRQDLKSLLTEMRTLIHNQGQQHQLPLVRDTGNRTRPDPDIQYSLNSSLDINAVIDVSDNEERDKTKKVWLEDGVASENLRGRKYTSTNKKDKAVTWETSNINTNRKYSSHLSPQSRELMIQQLEPSIPSHTRSSSYYDLLGEASTAELQPFQSDQLETASSLSDSYIEKRLREWPREVKKPVQRPVVPSGGRSRNIDGPRHHARPDPQPAKAAILDRNSHDLCRRLEEKIQSLTEMGGHLQLENKEVAAIMKDQGKRLRKVKHHEKNVKKLYQ